MSRKDTNIKILVDATHEKKAKKGMILYLTEDMESRFWSNKPIDDRIDSHISVSLSDFNSDYSEVTLLLERKKHENYETVQIEPPKEVRVKVKYAPYDENVDNKVKEFLNILHNSDRLVVNKQNTDYYKVDYYRTMLFLSDLEVIKYSLGHDYEVVNERINKIVNNTDPDYHFDINCLGGDYASNREGICNINITYKGVYYRIEDSDETSFYQYGVSGTQILYVDDNTPLNDNDMIKALQKRLNRNFKNEKYTVELSKENNTFFSVDRYTNTKIMIKEKDDENKVYFYYYSVPVNSYFDNSELFDLDKSTGSIYVIKDAKGNIKHTFTIQADSSRIFNYPEAEEDIVGDVNGDDELDLTDVLVSLKTLFNQKNTYNKAMDLNNDNKVDLTDILILLKEYFRKQA